MYSELARIDSRGHIAAPETPREILSPAVIRNGFTSFQIVVDAPADKEWWLFLGQNPENFFKLAAYRETRDALEPVELPYRHSGPEVFWLDLWTPADAPIDRVKVEAQLRINDDWIIYPVEARVTAARVPESGSTQPACRFRSSGSPGARFQLRNALQDGALAAQLNASEGAKLAALCAADPQNPESYLRVRDYLFGVR